MEGMGGEEEILKILDFGLGNFEISLFENTAESGELLFKKFQNFQIQNPKFS
jgi:hypothetical protein